MQVSDAQNEGASLPRRRLRVLLLVAAVLLSGAVLVTRWWIPLHTTQSAIDLLRELGAEVQPRALTREELQFAFESRPIQGKLAPNETLASLIGNGDVVLLHFWASWCPPCIQELPELLKLAADFRGRRLRLVAISHDDAWADLDGALQRATGKGLPTDGTWLRDPGGNSADPSTMLRTRLGTDKLPETYVIVDGQILGRFINSQPWLAPQMKQLFELLAAKR